MVVGTAAWRPPILTLSLRQGQVVDAREAHPHQPVLVEFPVLVSIAAKPLAAVVVPFVGETHGDAIVPKGPQLLDETVIELARPFARQERLDGLAALEELRAVSPAAVRGVREGHSRWIAAVPCVLGQTHFLGGRRNVEGR